MNADIDGKVTASVNRLLQEEPLDPQSFAPSKRRSIPRNVSKWFDEGSEYFSAGFAKTSVVSLHEFLNPNAAIQRVAASKVSKCQSGRSATSLQWFVTGFFQAPEGLSQLEPELSTTTSPG